MEARTVQIDFRAAVDTVNHQGMVVHQGVVYIYTVSFKSITALYG